MQANTITVTHTKPVAIWSTDYDGAAFTLPYAHTIVSKRQVTDRTTEYVVRPKNVRVISASN
jgi:hypothetical protein